MLYLHACCRCSTYTHVADAASWVLHVVFPGVDHAQDYSAVHHYWLHNYHHLHILASVSPATTVTWLFHLCFCSNTVEAYDDVMTAAFFLTISALCVGRVMFNYFDDLGIDLNDYLYSSAASSTIHCNGIQSAGCTIIAALSSAALHLPLEFVSVRASHFIGTTHVVLRLPNYCGSTPLEFHQLRTPYVRQRAVPSLLCVRGHLD